MDTHWFDELRDEVADVMQSVEDTFTIGSDRLVRVLGLEAELPDLILTDADRAELDARALGRTLNEIDRLPAA